MKALENTVLSTRAIAASFDASRPVLRWDRLFHLFLRSSSIASRIQRRVAATSLV